MEWRIILIDNIACSTCFRRRWMRRLRALEPTHQPQHLLERAVSSLKPGILSFIYRP